MKKDAGIIYVATKKETYVVEAFLSASSAKELMPELPITLFTNLEDSAFAQDDCFDQVISVQEDGKFKSQWAEGQFERIRCLNRSPYRYTLQLDTDTRVLSAEIADVFDKLDHVDIAMAEAAEDASVSRSAYGHSMFNVGFILYRQSEKVKKLFQEWESLTRKNFEMASMEPVPEVACLAHIKDEKFRRNLLFMDQISMVQLLSPDVNKFDLELEILDESWNFRGSDTGRVLDRPVKMDHRPELRDRLQQDIIGRTTYYEQNGRVQQALDIYQGILKNVPGDPMLTKCAARCFATLGDKGQAAALLTKVLGADPGDQEAQAALLAIKSQ